VELLFLPEHGPITGHDLSTLHQQESEHESGDQDVSVPRGGVFLVGFPGYNTDVPLFLLHDRLALLVLFLEVSRIRAIFVLLFLHHLDSILGFVRFVFLLLFRAEFFHEFGEDATVGHELDVGSALHDLSIGDGVNVVDLGEEVQSVGDEDLGPAFGVIHEHSLEHRPADVGIQSGKGILRFSCQ
jgi:hypothetical protein